MGLMRSPMTAILWRSAGRLTMAWAEVTVSAGAMARTDGVRSSMRPLSRRIYSGSVPQHPPITETPASIMAVTASAYSGAWMS